MQSGQGTGDGLLLLALGLGRRLGQALRLLPREVPGGIHLLPRARAGLGGEGEVHGDGGHRHDQRLPVLTGGPDPQQLVEVQRHRPVVEVRGEVGEGEDGEGLVGGPVGRDRVLVVLGHLDFQGQPAVELAPGVVRQAVLAMRAAGVEGHFAREPRVPADPADRDGHGVPLHVGTPIRGEQGLAGGSLHRAELLGEAPLVVGAHLHRDGGGPVRQGPQVDLHHLHVRAAVLVVVQLGVGDGLPVGAGGEQGQDEKVTHDLFLGACLTSQPKSRRFFSTQQYDGCGLKK